MLKSYIHAVTTHSLRDTQNNHSTAKLSAMALSPGIGADLIRARYCDDREAMKRLIQPWREMVDRMMRRKGLLRYMRLAEEVADISLQYWLSSNCPGCNGIGLLVIPGTPHLNAVCQDCLGTGLRQMDFDVEIKDIVRDCINILDDIKGASLSAAKKKLG